jgi:hypothetical protein
MCALDSIYQDNASLLCSLSLFITCDVSINAINKFWIARASYKNSSSFRTVLYVWGTRLGVGIASKRTWSYKILVGFKSIKLKSIIPACSRLGSCCPGVKDCMLGGGGGGCSGKIIIAGLSSERGRWGDPGAVCDRERESRLKCRQVACMPASSSFISIWVYCICQGSRN